MSSDHDELSDEGLDENVGEGAEIDDIQPPVSVPQRQNKRGRRPIDVNRIVPSGPLRIHPSEWENQRYSIPHVEDPFSDDDDDASSSEAEGEKEDSESSEENVVGMFGGGRRNKRARMDDLPAEADNPEDPVPLNVPAAMMLWVVTRFIANGGMREDEAALRQTIRDFWEHCIVDMMEQRRVVMEPPGGNGDGNGQNQEEEEEDSCWMCDYGLGDFDRLLSTDAANMNKLFERHVLQMHPKTLANILHTYYMDYIYKPMKKEGKRPPPWSKKMAREHVLVHMRDVRVRLMVLDMRMTDMMDMMTDNMFEPHEADPERWVHRPEVLRDFNSVFDRWLKLRNQKPSGMIGHNPDLNIDPNGGSELIRYASLKVRKED